MVHHRLLQPECAIIGVISQLKNCLSIKFSENIENIQVEKIVMITYIRINYILRHLFCSIAFLAVLIVCRTYRYNSKRKFFFFLVGCLLRLTTPLRSANGLSSENVLSVCQTDLYKRRPSRLVCPSEIVRKLRVHWLILADSDSCPNSIQWKGTASEHKTAPWSQWRIQGKARDAPHVLFI